MNLATADYQQIRTLIREELESVINVRIDPRFDTLEGKLKALENDVKDIYSMLSELQTSTRKLAHYEKYDLEQKIVSSYMEILTLAKEAGVKLPQA
ncbi:MAG: hypothetical protein WAQ57_03735 [Candidatus Saccharimonadales bacterium]